MGLAAAAKLRAFVVGRHRFRLAGLSAGDPYFRQIKGRFEAKFQAVCARALRPGGVALDVGANIGVTALIMSAFVGDQGRVVAFEPGRQVFDLLQRNVELNGVGNVELRCCALSSSVGRMGFHEDSAFGHLVPEGAPETVEVSTLDAVAEELGLARLDLIKIDTEGFEPHVLAGGRQVLERLRPIIYLELNAWTLLISSRTDPLVFLRDLVRLYPHVLRVRRGGGRLALEQIPGSPDEAAAILLRDNICYYNSFNDLMLLPDAAAVARFADIIGPPERPGGSGLPRLARAVVRRLWGR